MRAKDAFLYRKEMFYGDLDIQQTFIWKGKEYTIRPVVLQQDYGERETLRTSLPVTFQLQDLEMIYAKRWDGILNRSNCYLKHRLQTKDFSGYSACAVLQDFHATVCINSIAAAFKGDVELEVKSDTETYI